MKRKFIISLALLSASYYGLKKHIHNSLEKGKVKKKQIILNEDKKTTNKTLLLFIDDSNIKDLKAYFSKHYGNYKLVFKHIGMNNKNYTFYHSEKELLLESLNEYINKHPYEKITLFVENLFAHAYIHHPIKGVEKVIIVNCDESLNHYLIHKYVDFGIDTINEFFVSQEIQNQSLLQDINQSECPLLFLVSLKNMIHPTLHIYNYYQGKKDFIVLSNHILENMHQNYQDIFDEFMR